MMALDDWTFSDNVFRDIKGRIGGGRAAIFIWVRSRRVVVQRNLIANCDRGVAFGNPGRSTANIDGDQPVYVSDGVIRNNFIVGGPDRAIELWYSDLERITGVIDRTRPGAQRSIRSRVVTPFFNQKFVQLPETEGLSLPNSHTRWNVFMVSKTQSVVAIDVSKGTLDVCVLFGLT